ncbi:MAG: class I SAM-dependent methyltransferase [Planctomycetes bacterium]|nr:class I SAM-dependent methyltransferase [Planctomycetota bacterium]
MPHDDGKARPWADELRRAWERRSRSPHREFYVASHRGWKDDDRVRQQAAFDAAVVLHGLDDAWLADAHVLEIGCGSGRLARQIAPQVKSYSGFDIAPGMVEAAEARLDDVPNARVVVGHGDAIPDALDDRAYDVVFSHAVLIHCPLDIVVAYVRDALRLLAPGGRLRLQLRADADDPEGILPMAQAPALRVAPPSFDETPIADDEQRDLVAIDGELNDTYYMGHAFGHAEADALLRDLAPDAEVRVMRFDPSVLYAEVAPG